MDTNLAFAILLLIAAIVALYFWVDRGEEEVEDIYNDRHEVTVPRDNGVDNTLEDDAEMDGLFEDQEMGEISETPVTEGIK